MRIGLIAPPWLPVPPPAYGGTEAVIDRLARGLVAAGHEVRLVTVGESTCPVPSVWRYETAVEPMENSVLELAHVISAYDLLEDVDVVHDHTVLGPLVALQRRRRPPVATTIHSPFTRDTRTIQRLTAGRIPLVCISRSQRESAPEIPVAAVIHHGIDVESFPTGDGAGGYLLFLGRMSPDKGVHQAVAIARAAGLPLRIAAKMREEPERQYFAEQVEPLLGGDVEYVGEADEPERLRLLQGALALLNPIQWPEPFGLVMIEALATGTPVVGTPFGAAPEIVDHGRTGFLGTTEEELVAALAEVGSLDRAACRESARRRFSTERMVADHAELYRRLLDAPEPVTPADRDRQARPTGRSGGLVPAAA